MPRSLAIVRKTVQLIWYRSDFILPLRNILALQLAEKNLAIGYSAVPMGVSCVNLQDSPFFLTF